MLLFGKHPVSETSASSRAEAATSRRPTSTRLSEIYLSLAPQSRGRKSTLQSPLVRPEHQSLCVLPLYPRRRHVSCRSAENIPNFSKSDKKKKQNKCKKERRNRRIQSVGRCKRSAELEKRNSAQGRMHLQGPLLRPPSLIFPSIPRSVPRQSKAVHSRYR